MSHDRSLKISRFFLTLWLLALSAMAVIALKPEANATSRLNAAGFVLGLLTTVVMLLWHDKRLRKLALAGVAALALLLVIPWPIRTAPDALRARYVECLRTYEGCLYFWGGESRHGIDCSGLIRRGLIDACFHKSVTSLDPGLARQALSLWWNDTNAKALGEEHVGLTKHLFDSDDLKNLAHAKLQPGDIAVTSDGVHILAYLGEQSWIEADPGMLKVLKIHAPTTDNGWFLRPVKIMRWSLLSEK